MKAILIRLLKFIKRERFIESEYCNSDKDLNLNKKTLSKLVRSNVISCDISSDFTTIVCFCGKKGKLKFLKMRKYIKAEPNHLEVCELAKNYCIPQ